MSIISVTSLDRDLVLGAVAQLRGQGVDGILLITPQESAVEAVLHLPGDMPVVAVEAGPDESVPVVTVDQVAGAAAATRHLLELGHRTVWHVAGPGGLARGGPAHRGLDGGAGGRGRRPAAAAVGRLERTLGLRARPAAGRRP